MTIERPISFLRGVLNVRGVVSKYECLLEAGDEPTYHSKS